jgi:hypothetical protein
MTARRFPPAWSVEDIGAAFGVRDSAFYFGLTNENREHKNDQRPFVTCGCVAPKEDEP